MTSRDHRAADQSQLVVVTGLSGAGKTTALRALADVGFYCVDNLPPAVVSSTVGVCASGGLPRVALGIDVRVGTFLDSARTAIEALDQPLVVLFLDASDEVLIRRFSETRRPHPMLHMIETEDDDTLTVIDGVQLERLRLSPIRRLATHEIDTSLMTVHELRRRVIDELGPARDQPGMAMRIVSFGFKYGVPLDSDVVFDVRFLDNPYFVADLRELTGTQPAVSDFVLRSPGAAELLDHLGGLLEFAVPRYEREGRSYLTIAVGCTGGHHRSVAVAEALAERLRARTRRPIGVLHRDMERDGMNPAGRSARRCR